MAKNISKEELKTDSFLQFGEKALRVLEDKWPAILAVVGLIVVAGASYAGYEKWAQYTEEKAQTEVFVWMNQLDKKRESFARQKQASMVPDAQGKLPQASVSENYDNDYASIVSGLEAEIKNHKKTVAGQAAAMRLAEFLAEQKRVEQASVLLQEVEAGLDKNSWIFGLYKVQLAALLSQTGKTQEAIDQLNKVTEAKASKFLHPEALLKMAVLQEELGQPDKARELYTRLSTEYAETEAGRSAQSMSRLLDIQQKLTPANSSTPKSGASL